MSRLRILAALIMLLTSVTANAADVHLAFKQGQPATAEFIRGAKRALFLARYEIEVASDSRVIGVYNNWMTMEIHLREDGIVIRNTDPADYRKRDIKRFTENLVKNLTYEFARYVI